MSMINSARDTKGFSTAVQESSLKTENKNFGALGETGVPEGKDLGTFLNEIADPNWVDPTKTRKVGNNQLDKDAFFKLMLAQIKHQDPMNPMKSDEMAAQLAQFTSLEQLMNVNSKLDTLAKVQQPATQYQALNFIGKSIAADTSKIVRNVGDKTHELRYMLPKDAANAVVLIKNEAGEEVRRYEIPNAKKGENKVTWNGLDKNQAATRAGEYYFEVQATGGAGEKIGAQTAFKGKVTGVNYTTQGPVLMVGDQSVRLSDVQKIEDSAARAELAATEDQKQNLALNAAPKKVEDEVEGAKPPNKGNLDSIAMAQAMIDQTNKAKAEVQREEAKKVK